MIMNSREDKIMEKSKLTKTDFWKVFFRSCTLDSALNYERQQNLMYCYMILQFLKGYMQMTKKKWQMH